MDVYVCVYGCTIHGYRMGVWYVITYDIIPIQYKSNLICLLFYVLLCEKLHRKKLLLSAVVPNNGGIICYPRWYIKNIQLIRGNVYSNKDKTTRVVPIKNS